MAVYKSSPEILDVVVDDDFLSKVKIRSLETPWGLSEQEYIYYQDILMGEIRGSTKLGEGYYNGVGVEYENRTVIHLTPKIKGNEFLPIPSVDDFFAALVSLLESNSGWSMICEQSCDYCEIKYISFDSDEYKSKFIELSEYCLGKRGMGPTFILQPKIVQTHPKSPLIW